MVDLAGNLGGRGHAVHRLQQALGPVIGQDRRSLLAIGLQPHGDRLGPIIRAADELGAAAAIAMAGLRGLPEFIVVAGAAFGASEAPSDSRIG